MTRTRARGPLLSSVVMVALASVATGLLAVVGFQAIPETVVQSTFGSHDEKPRHVLVSETPRPSHHAVPSATPAAVPSTAAPARAHHGKRTSDPTTGPTATQAGRHSTPTAAPKKTSPTPTPSKSPSPNVSPSAACHNKHKCPQVPVTSYDPSGTDTTPNQPRVAAPVKPGKRVHGRHHAHLG